MYAIQDSGGKWVSASRKAALDRYTLNTGRRISAANLERLPDGALAARGVRRLIGGSPPDAPLPYQSPVPMGIVTAGSRAIQTWGFVDEPLTGAKVKALGAVAQQRAIKEAGGVEHAGHQLPTDPASMRLYNAITGGLAAGATYPVNGIRLKATRLSDGLERRIAVDQVLWAVLATKIATLFIQAENVAAGLEDDIEAVATVADLRAIDIEGAFA